MASGHAGEAGARLVSWSRWHSGAAALIGPAILAGLVLRASGSAGPATALVFGGGAVALLGAVIGFWSMGSSPVPGGEAQQHRVWRVVRRGEPVAPGDRDTARALAVNELRGQPTQVWAPLMIATVASAGLPLRSLGDALWLMFVLAAVGLAGRGQLEGRRCRRVVAGA